MNTVHLVGDIGDKFGHKWSMNISDYGEIIRLIDCQREGFRKYLIESEENEIGFVIQRADEYINDEVELLLSLNNEDIIITAIPLGAGSTGNQKGGFMGTAFGKIILGATLVLIGYYLPQVFGSMVNFGGGMGVKAGVTSAWVSSAWATTLGGMMMTVGTSLMMQGVEQYLTKDPVSANQKDGYLFDGGTNTIAQGQPVPLLYGELLIAGTPISATMTTFAIPLSWLDYSRDKNKYNTSWRAFSYQVAQVKAATEGEYQRTGDGEDWDYRDEY